LENIELFTKLHDDLKNNDTKSLDTDSSNGSIESKPKLRIPWDQIILKLKTIAKTNTGAFKVLALLYIHGYVYHISKIYKTTINDDSSINNLNTDTGVLDYVTGKTVMSIVLPKELVQEFGLHANQKYLFSTITVGTDGKKKYEHAAEGFYKKLFQKGYSPANCQRSYLSWVIVNTRDMDEVIGKATEICAVNEGTRLINSYLELVKYKDYSNEAIEQILLEI
jgi:hypothetical protein